MNKRNECLKYLRDIGLPTESAETMSDHEIWQTCFGFGSHFGKSADGRTRLPLVKFEAEKRTKTVEMLTSDDLSRFVEGVGAAVAIVAPRVSLASRSQKTTLFTLDWQVHKSVVYGSGPDIAAAWEAIEKVGKPLTADGDVKDVATQIRQSITSEIQNPAKVPKYSNGVPRQIVDPFEPGGEICKQDANVVSHYMAVLGGVESNIEERQILGSDATVLDMKCHMPALAQELCSKCHCQNRDVHCDFCPHSCELEPQIVILDGELDKDAIERSPSLGEAHNACDWAEWDSDKFHGTHMAGLAAGRKKFFGIAPSAEVAHIRRRPSDEALLDRAIRQKYNNLHRPAVFLFASQFCYQIDIVNAMLEGGRVENPCDLLGRRIRDSEVSKRERIIMSSPINRVIRDGQRYPWVVAIGQPGDNAAVAEVSERSLASPMILADLPHVILVTACNPCDTNDPRLWPQAHRGKERWRPHIAAPGGIGKSTYFDRIKRDGFPSVADKNRYTTSFGTSQSAAVVAGVVAKMQSCYPGYYDNPSAVKLALQVTAKPITHDDDRPYIASGVIDVGAALKHPAFHYLKDDEGDRDILDDGQAPVGWCNRELTFHPLSGPWTVKDAANIRRIVEVERGKWVIRLEQNGVIDSSEIVFSSTPEMILKFGDRTLDLNRIKDLTTFRGLDVVSCQ